MSAEALRSFVRQGLEQLLKRQRSQVRRVTVTKSDDTGKVRTLQIQGIADQVNSKVEHFEPFGFSGNPPAGAEGIKLEVGGDPAHPIVVVAFDRRYRIVNLQPGEAVVFDQWGDYIKLDKNRNITINAGANVNISAATKVTVIAPNAEFTGALKVDGNLTVSKNLTVTSSASFGKLVTIATTGLKITAGGITVGGVPMNVP